jgi:DNA polymerase I-like protein with 3'-5' exonuclease and polymerase domains
MFCCAAEYTESCNTQFQGLASDGAKLALYAVSQRYPVVAFVHDELVVEVPADSPEAHGKVIEKLMCENMDQVLGGYVKSEVEWVVSDNWSK